MSHVTARDGKSRFSAVSASQLRRFPIEAEQKGGGDFHDDNGGVWKRLDVLTSNLVLF